MQNYNARYEEEKQAEARCLKSRLQCSVKEEDYRKQYVRWQIG